MKYVSIGNKTIELNDSLQDASMEQVKQVLQLQYPEIASAKLSEKIDPDTGDVYILVQARPGRKG